MEQTDGLGRACLSLQTKDYSPKQGYENLPGPEEESFFLQGDKLHKGKCSEGKPGWLNSTV